MSSTSNAPRRAGPPPPAASPPLRNPAFEALVKERSSFAWTLSVIMVVVYLAFILLVAFGHDLMATKVGAGPMSLGILLGLFVIVFAFVLTGLYVARANTRFDELTRQVTRSVTGRRP